jgi:hypothetical protein
LGKKFLLFTHDAIVRSCVGNGMIHINEFLGAFTLFFFFLQGAISVGHHQYFGRLGTPQIEALLWTPTCQIETNVLHIDNLFSLYTWELNFG